MNEYISNIKSLNKESLSARELRDYKSSLIIKKKKDPTNLVCLATHKNSDKNKIHYLKMEGIPIYGSHIVFNPEKSYYSINCYDYIKLGKVFISCEISLNEWVISVPLTESLIKKNLNDIQLETLNKFISNYPCDFDITYLQMLV